MKKTYKGTNQARVKNHAQAMAHKGKVLEELQDRFGRATIAILTDYRGKDAGLSVHDIGKLRGKLRGQRAEYTVVKNTLLARALEKLGIQGLDGFLSAPTAVTFGFGDPVAAAKALVDFAHETKSAANEVGLPALKAGYMDGRVFTARQVRDLAKLPSKEQLLQQLLGLMLAPHRNLLGVLNGSARNVVNLMEAIRKKQEGAAA